MKRLIAILLSVLTLLPVVGCADTVNAKYSYEESAPSLCEEFSKWFRVGAAINPWQWEDKDSLEYKHITKQYNTFVLENDSKPDRTQPSEGNFTFDVMDEYVKFGEETGAVLRGHTLLWHIACPDWFFYDNGKEAAPELVMERLKTHIATVVGRYKGQIDTWDVCNEVIDDNGGLRPSNWLLRIGDLDGDGDDYDFLEEAFRTAHEADPDARLILNDYGLEWNKTRAISAYMIIKDMMEEGVPIDGIGLQMHHVYSTNAEGFRESIEVLAKLKEINPDFTIEITELDVNMYDWGEEGVKEYTDEMKAMQCAAYVSLFNLFIDLAEEGLLDSVVFWGINDANSWLNGEDRPAYPSVFGSEFELKDSFIEIVKLARERK